MNTRTLYLAATIFSVVMVSSFSLAYGQGTFGEKACPNCEGDDVYTQAKSVVEKEIPILIKTDKSVYDHKSQIRIDGSVSAVKAGANVGLRVMGPPPFNNIVTVAQATVGPDGKFSTTLNTSGDLWKYDGIYTILATYGGESARAKATVELTGGIIKGPSVTCAANELAASGQCIPYTITGATVTSARINVGTTSLIINISPSDEGTITLEIPRRVLDTDATSDPLFVLVNGEEVESEETATATTRTVTISFGPESEEIEIIGTFAIPEFGAVAALILAVAIISIIAVTAKTRLNVLVPKY